MHSQESQGMNDRLPVSTVRNHRLRFACACASANPIAADPWVAIVNQHKLNDGTKERILNVIYRQPRTVTQLAELLTISVPGVHRHVGELVADELIHEADGAEPSRSRSSERYYRPNFPVVFAADRTELQPALEDLAEAFGALFREHRPALATALRTTSVSTRGESLDLVFHYLFATATRIAREQLELTGDLPLWPEHRDGSRWVWWAEEAEEAEVA
jgi:hypothetical protein